MLSIAQQIYYKWDICHKKSTSDEGRFTGVLSESKVDLNPHQVEAALFAFKSPLSKGAILADEVGLGKTIEAGILLSELWAEHKRHILIIVPASLRNQWSMELLEKFFLPSLILEQGSYKTIAAKTENPFQTDESIIICSYQFAVTHADELSKVMWNLVVIDEAHKLRNVYKKGNVTANVLKETLRPYKKILLTATPLQNNLRELYGLISIIDDEFFSSVQTFEEQYNTISIRDNSKYGELKARIAHIAHRTLRNQVQEYVKYTKRIPFVQEYHPSKKEIDLYEAVSDYLFREGTYGIPDRIRPLLSFLYRKIMSSSAYALSFTLQSTIERLKRIKDEGRQILSMSSVLNDLETIDNDDNSDSYETVEISEQDKAAIDNEIEELRHYVSMAEGIGCETKAQALLKALTASFDKVERLGGLRRALIFTESRKTQEYLKNFFEANGFRDKVVCFNGTNSNDEANNIYQKWLLTHAGTSYVTGNFQIDKKQALVDFFKDSAEIMIATEAGAEGINLQFCSLVVNYDMPWNPQRIEQRIGRCHRYGQKHDVVVVNFVNKANAADCRVYELLSTKFNLFEGVLGSSDEILGSIDSTFDLESRLSSILRVCRTESEINKAFDSLQKELEDVISERIKDTKKTLLENFDEDVVNLLKVRQDDDEKRIDSYIRHFWKLALVALNGFISDINENTSSFKLDADISNEIKAGVYSVNKKETDKIQIRATSSIGSYILRQIPYLNVVEDVTFDLTSYPYRSILLEEYKDKAGWLIAYEVSSTNEYDDEENIIFCAITDDKYVLPAEFGFKLLELEAKESVTCKLPDHIKEDTEYIFDKNIEKYKDQVNARMEEYASYEIEKYESWSDDKLVPLQKEIIDIRKERDTIHRQIRKEKDIKTKLLLKKQENHLSEKLSKKQRQLFDLEDEYNKNVDTMTTKLLKSLECNFDKRTLFSIRWRIV